MGAGGGRGLPNKRIPVSELLDRLRDGAASRREVFPRLVEAGCTLVAAAEMACDPANNPALDAPEPQSVTVRKRTSRPAADATPSRDASAGFPSSGEDVTEAFPIFYNGLVVEKTFRCNAKCAMCYQYAGPKGSDLLGGAEMEAPEIARLVVEAAELDALVPRFHLSGGEAFLDVESCIELFRVGRAAGFFDLMTTTNAYWARTEDVALDVCRRLREAGLTRMEISWDVWHLPYIRVEAVQNCIRASSEAGIETQLHILSSKSHSYQEALDTLSDESLEQVDRVMCGPVMPTGRAAEEVDPEEIHGSSDLSANCHTFLNLTIGPTGEVSPCCAGLDHTEAQLCGNVRERPLADIVEGMNSSLLVRTLVLGGVSRLKPVLEQHGVSLGSDYRSICHLCWEIFSRPERVEIVKSHFVEVEKRLAASQAAAAMWNVHAGPG